MPFGKSTWWVNVAINPFRAVFFFERKELFARKLKKITYVWSGKSMWWSTPSELHFFLANVLEYMSSGKSTVLENVYCCCDENYYMTCYWSYKFVFKISIQHLEIPVSSQQRLSPLFVGGPLIIVGQPLVVIGRPFIVVGCSLFLAWPLFVGWPLDVNSFSCPFTTKVAFKYKSKIFSVQTVKFLRVLATRIMKPFTINFLSLTRFSVPVEIFCTWRDFLYWTRKSELQMYRSTILWEGIKGVCITRPVARGGARGAVTPPHRQLRSTFLKIDDVFFLEKKKIFRDVFQKKFLMTFFSRKEKFFLEIFCKKNFWWRFFLEKKNIYWSHPPKKNPGYGPDNLFGGCKFPLFLLYGYGHSSVELNWTNLTYLVCAWKSSENFFSMHEWGWWMNQVHGDFHAWTR